MAIRNDDLQSLLGKEIQSLTPDTISGDKWLDVMIDSLEIYRMYQEDGGTFTATGVTGFSPATVTKVETVLVSGAPQVTVIFDSGPDLVVLWSGTDQPGRCVFI